ncbi:MAG: glycosyltransferase family 4 protein [Flavobacteriia bacterium]|nr:glycosyltransferase family 4 protein [Flavobacteriia bacterium]
MKTKATRKSKPYKVAFVTEILTHYRIPFHEQVRQKLLERNVSYEVYYSDPTGDAALKFEKTDLQWGKKIKSVRIGNKAIWQPIKEALNADLIIVGQENKLIATYYAIIWGKIARKKIAFFGHGKNFQSKHSASHREKWKKFWATKVFWWFGYTDETRIHLETLGFPEKKITIFQNSIDTSKITEELGLISQQQHMEMRENLLDNSDNVGIYVGGIYKEKRISFLLEAALYIREALPNFQLIVIGSGPDENMIGDRNANWIHFVGPKYAMQKTELISQAKVWLMPGLVGLAVVDSFAYGIPMVTCDLDYHSPEFAYLRNMENGIILPEQTTPKEYADAIADLLQNKDLLSQLSTGAKMSKTKYTIEAMSDRFVEGVIMALKAKIN